MKLERKPSDPGLVNFMASTLARGAVCALLLLSAGAVNAATVVNDNFDGYADQAAFQAVWASIGTEAPTSAALSTAQASSGAQSIRAPGIASTTTGQTQSRNRLTFAETGNVTTLSLITWSFDFYDSAGGNPQRNFSNLQDTTAPGATGQLISMGLNNNQLSTASGGNYYMARILGYAPTAVDPDGGPGEDFITAGVYFKLNDFGVGLRSIGWHNLKVVISTDNGLSTDFAFYVDNVLAERVSNVGTAASIRSYDNIALGSGLSNGSVEAFFDNMYLEVAPVPEPGAFAFAALGIGALLFVRKFRR